MIDKGFSDGLIWHKRGIELEMDNLFPFYSISESQKGVNFFICTVNFDRKVSKLDQIHWRGRSVENFDK